MSLAVPWFVLSILLVTRLPELLPIPPLLVGLPLAFFGLGCRITVPYCAFYLGLVFALISAQSGLDKSLPMELENRVLDLKGHVVGLPVQKDGIERFRFQVESINGEDDSWTGLVSLSWYRSPIAVYPGDHLRISAKLANPRASLNPGVFDYEGWLFFNGISATGYVKGGEAFERIKSSLLAGQHHGYRWYLREKIMEMAGHSSIKGLLVALAIGESGQMSTEQWGNLTQTGTNHLLIISGLHVGLVAALVFRIMRFLPIPTRWIGVGTSLLITAYAFIAGFGLPVQRALIMSCAVLLAVCIDRRVTLPTLFSASMLGVVLLQPFAVMSTGFWLSFGAVFALLFAFGGRIEEGGKISLPAVAVTAVKTQWVVFVTMFPLLLLFVYQVSLIGFLVNLIAIPFVSLFVIPFLLMFVLLVPLSDVLSGFALSVSEFFLAILWEGIHWAAELDWVYQNQMQTLRFLPIFIMLLGAYILFVPRGILPKWLSAFCLLPILALQHDPGKDLGEGEVKVSFIDVGQGLSVLVRTRYSALLYDAGPSFGSRFDSGVQTITPFLRHQGINQLDTLIISHGDNDHAGGAESISRRFYPTKVFIPRPGHASCNPGEIWYKDKVRFEVFTLKGSDLSDNNLSCLLLVTGSGFGVLLTGDVEEVAEQALREILLPDLDLISVPHHGSRTSSSPGFINQVQANVAVVSAGHQNRFGHPDAAVLRRYAIRQVRVLNTAAEGGITLVLGDQGIKRIDSARLTMKRFWHRQRLKNDERRMSKNGSYFNK
jgi:competence protein ComEC